MNENQILEVFENDHILQLPSSNYQLELRKLDLDAFPIIDNFKMELIDTKSDMGFHLRFVSEHLGILTSFPWWDNVQDILTQTSDDSIVGSISNPFDDLEQGWQILIWEHENYVYIMEGEEPQCTEFAVWFRVGKQRYYTQWEALKRSLK